VLLILNNRITRIIAKKAELDLFEDGELILEAGELTIEYEATKS